MKHCIKDGRIRATQTHGCGGRGTTTCAGEPPLVYPFQSGLFQAGRVDQLRGLLTNHKLLFFSDVVFFLHLERGLSF